MTSTYYLKWRDDVYYMLVNAGLPNTKESFFVYLDMYTKVLDKIEKFRISEGYSYNRTFLSKNKFIKYTWKELFNIFSSAGLE